VFEFVFQEGRVPIESGGSTMKHEQRHAEKQLLVASEVWCRAYCAVNRRACALPLTWMFILFISFPISARADDSASRMREGLKQYAAEQFDEASKSFAAATESLEKSKSDQAAVSAYDEACALHRKGDLESARDRYLKAGLSQDKGIATSAHFNLGLIASEQARKLAGEAPETIPDDKRKEILGEIRKSIESYRHCLELEPRHTPSRRNLELLREWTKYYTDRWRDADLQKRRDETSLIQFLDYLMATQLAFEESVKGFRSSTSPNAFAEMKRVQSELRDEIPYLKDKIDSELRPKESDPQSTAPSAKDSKADEELERGIALLSGWADEAASKMVAAEKDLAKRDATSAASQQQKAADQLDQIWDAIVPFHPLLAKELAEQTQIAKQISTPSGTKEGLKSEEEVPPQILEVKDNEWIELLKKQERVLRKTRLMVPKAEYELEQVESQPKPDVEASNPPETTADPSVQAAPQVDPEAIKAGYQKAIELAPKAIEEMGSAVKQMVKRDLVQAAAHAEEARRILQEIQDAQPKNPQQDQNKDQQQDQKKEDKENKDTKEDKEKQDEQKKDDQKKDDQKNQKQEEDKDGKDKQNEQRPEPKVSQDRIEEILRRVREREQVKRERDRELKARVLGRVPVDKDW